MWGNTEKILYIICNAEGEIPRKSITKYASPISNELEEKLKEGSIELESEAALKYFVKTVQDGQRYYGINFSNIGEKKNTIEFRLSNGTIDENTWVENINLYGGIVMAAEELALIQNKPEQERTEEELKKLESFEDLKNQNLTNQKKLDKLLSLVVSEKSKDIYQRRFRTNSLLISFNPILRYSISKKVTHNSVDIKKTTDKILIGKDRVTGSDYKKISEEFPKKEIVNENIIR